MRKFYLTEDQINESGDVNESGILESSESNSEDDANHGSHDTLFINSVDNLDEHPEDLKDFLRSWYFSNRVRISQLDSLLKGLRSYGHTNLPKLGRTLLGTPRRNEIVALEPGKYGHYGLKRAFIDHIDSSNQGTMPRLIKIFLYTDGFPIFSKEA